MAHPYIREVYEPEDYEVEAVDYYRLPGSLLELALGGAFVGAVSVATALWIYDKLGWDFGKESTES
jgi:hypothetical protein